MQKIKLKTFKSPLDFLGKFFGLFKGPTFISTFLKTDRKFFRTNPFDSCDEKQLPWLSGYAFCPWKSAWPH